MPTKPVRAPRVLIVDDNPDIGLALNLALERAGFEVAAAPSEARALELQRRLPADILIADIFMSLTDSAEAIGRLKREFPGTKIVALSRGAKRAGNLATAGIPGADITLRQPFETRILVETLHGLMAAGPRITIP